MAAPDLLLAEDDVAAVEIAMHTLRKHGLENRTQVVYDGEEAVEFLTATGRYADRSQSPLHVPKVVLLDLKMPFLNGLEVLRFMRGDERLRRVPVVMLTASEEESDIEACYLSGANSYVVKPLSYLDFTRLTDVLLPYWLQLNQVAAARDS